MNKDRYAKYIKDMETARQNMLRVREDYLQECYHVFYTKYPTGYLIFGVDHDDTYPYVHITKISLDGQNEYVLDTDLNQIEGDGPELPGEVTRLVEYMIEAMDDDYLYECEDEITYENVTY